MIDKPIITLDVDWAPDFLIREVAGMLLKRKVRATWFITHRSQATGELCKNPEFFEIGIHPNFMPGSTQGNTIEESMDYLLAIHGDARIIRTHGLYQSTRMFEMILKKYPQIKIDLSLFLPYSENISPHFLSLCRDGKQKGIFRIPYFWEDDFELLQKNPCWKPQHSKYNKRGIRIFNFHPIHIALNSDDFRRYERFMRECGACGYSKEKIRGFINKRSQGVGTFFNSLLDQISKSRRANMTLKEIYADCCHR